MPRRRLPTLPEEPVGLPAGLPDAVLASVGFLAGQVGGRMRARFEAVLAEHALHPRHYLMLLVLRDEGIMAQQALGARVGMDRTTTMQAAQYLADTGALERRDDPDDRRVYRLALTAAGRRLVGSLEGRIRRAEQDMLAPLTAEERTALQALLKRVLGGGAGHCDG